jgi:hypothetical protein
VPTELIGRDIAECCAAHLRKLAQLVLACFYALPLHLCPARAFTTEGMKALGYTFADVDAALGLPQGYTEIGRDHEFSVFDKLQVLSREIEPLDILEVERLADGKFYRVFPKRHAGTLETEGVMSRDGRDAIPSTGDRHLGRLQCSVVCCGESPVLRDRRNRGVCLPPKWGWPQVRASVKASVPTGYSGRSGCR